MGSSPTRASSSSFAAYCSGGEPIDETRPNVSLIVPTYREAANIRPLIERVDRVRREGPLAAELILVDDDSRDGIVEAVKEADKDWVRLIVRDGPRDLSLAVAEGMAAARGDVLAVMDADLSHPPEVLPRMVEGLAEGYDFVIGSRYASGGSTDSDWSAFRKLTSKTATLLARPLTDVHDPMSGFFALRRGTYAGAADALDPIGYKIGLELLTKCRCKKVLEVPIHFTDRQRGKSKFCFGEQVRYIRHLWRLMKYKYGRQAQDEHRGDAE